MVIKYLNKGLFLLASLGSSLCFSSPPFYTDDTEPAPYHQIQWYPFLYAETPTHNAFTQAPGLEVDYGFIPDTELHLVFSIASFIPQQGESTTGIGDIDVGIKRILVKESTYLPKIALAPVLTLPAGNAKRNLGNGRLWSSLPIWFEKNAGPWKVCFGGGYGFNSAPYAKNFLFGGFNVQRTLSEKLLLGAEIFAQGSTTTIHTAPFQDTGAVTLINLGTNYNFTPTASFFFSAGHSIAGVKQWVSYLGFYFAVDT